MHSVLFEFIIILLLVIANGLFAMSEIAVVSARKPRLQQRADAGNSGARAALELANTPNLFLSTVQIGITLVGIFAGAFGGATIGTDLGAWLSNFPWLAPYSGAIALGLVVLATTYLSIVLGELVPKRIALNNAEEIASLSARPIRILSLFVAPVVHLLSLSTELVVHLLGVRSPSGPSVTRQEVKAMIDEGTQGGVFEATQTEIVERVFQLGDRKASAFVTPRTEIVWLDLNDGPKEIRDKITSCRHSRFPVAAGGIEKVVGVVHVKDLLAQSLRRQRLDLKSVLQPAVFIPAGTPVLKILARFKETRAQLLLVIDEYGGVQGLVTLNDIVEAIAGDVGLQDSATEPGVIRREDGSWLLDGSLAINKFKELLQIQDLPEEGKYHTLAGFVLASLGQIPISGTHFALGEWLLEVVDMDGPRVDKVLVRGRVAS